MVDNPKSGDPTLASEQPRYGTSQVAPAEPDHTRIATEEQSLKGILERLNRVIDTDYDQLSAVDPTRRKTHFDEMVTASETTSFSLASQWDSLRLRNTINATGSGGVTSNQRGAYDITTGTTSGSSVALVSNQAGVYESGASAVQGIGTRALQAQSALSGDSFIQWGYYDGQNGFGFGVDATDLYVFIRRAGADQKFYRNDWSTDPLDGTGPSGYTVDLEEINIWQTYFTWYGSGELAFRLAKRSAPYQDQTRNLKLGHVYDPTEDPTFQGPSVLQPDLPFTCEASNGTTTDDVGLAVTGRSFRRLDERKIDRNRRPVESLIDYTNLTQGTYVPVFGLTKKDTYNSFPNQVNTRFSDAVITADQNISYRVEVGTDLIDRTTSTLTEVPGWIGQSSVLTGKGGNVAVNGNTGLPISEGVIRSATTQGNKGIASRDPADVNSPLGRGQDIVVFVRQDTSNATQITVTSRWSETF